MLRVTQGHQQHNYTIEHIWLNYMLWIFHKDKFYATQDWPIGTPLDSVLEFRRQKPLNAARQRAEKYRPHSPSKVPLYIYEEIFVPHLITVPWAQPSQYAIRHLDRFSRFCTAHQCVQDTHTQTDRQTDRWTYNATMHICHNRPHILLMRRDPSLRCFIQLKCYKG